MYNNHIMSLDQFYTKEDIAANYYVQLQTIVNVGDFDVILEPSAGKGSFFQIVATFQKKGNRCGTKNVRTSSKWTISISIPNKTKNIW